MTSALARRFRAVSGTVEEVLALAPDVVVGGSFLPPATAPRCAGSGSGSSRSAIATSVAESEAQVRGLAALAGHPERGEALVARIEAALAAGRAAAGLAPIARWSGRRAGSCPASGTLIADLLRRTGFASFSAARGMRPGRATCRSRQMLADPPRVILAAGDAHARRGPRCCAIRRWRALRRTRRERFDPRCCGAAARPSRGRRERLAEVRRSLAELGACPRQLRTSGTGAVTKHRSA